MKSSINELYEFSVEIVEYERKIVWICIDVYSKETGKIAYTRRDPLHHFVPEMQKQIIEQINDKLKN